MDLDELLDVESPIHGVHHVRSERHVEAIHRQDLFNAHQRSIRRIVREHLLDQLLRIEGDKARFLDQASEHCLGFIAREVERLGFGAQGHMDLTAEERTLLVAIDQHHRHTRVRCDELLESCLRIRSLNERMSLERLCARWCRGATEQVEHFGQVRHEAHARERFRYLRRIEIGKGKVFEVDLNWHITHDRGNFARKEGVFFMVREIL